MRAKLGWALAAGAGLAAPAAAQQEFVMYVNSSDPGAVSLRSVVDGSLVNPSFIARTGPGYAVNFPKAVAQVNDEVWLADQVADCVFRFDLNGRYYGKIGGELNNVRGLRPFAGHVYVTSADAIGGTPAASIVKFTTDGARVSSWVAGSSPFDVLEHNGELLVAHFVSSPDITRWDADGNPLGNFHLGAITNTQQIAHRANNNVLAAGFSGIAPPPVQGIYEYDPTGAQVGFLEFSGARGVIALSSGNLLATNSTGLHLYDGVSFTLIQASTGGAQYLERLRIGDNLSGACCFADGTCQIRSLAECGTQSGVFRGNLTACATANCPQPGACCANEGTCSFVLGDVCITGGGSWHGAGVACAAVSCPPHLVTPAASATASAAGSGIFFDLAATNALDVTRIDFFSAVAAGNPITVDLYTRIGSYVGHDTSPGDWSAPQTFSTTSAGTTVQTSLILPTPINMPAGSTLGVYLVGSAGGLRYRTSTSPNPVADSNLSLASDLFRSAAFAGTPTSGRRFAGSVWYTPAGGCYANCDASTAAPVLNVADFTCFLTRYAGGDPYANCDGSTAAPTLNVADFTCFLTKYAGGCP